MIRGTFPFLVMLVLLAGCAREPAPPVLLAEDLGLGAAEMVDLLGRPAVVSLHAVPVADELVTPVRLELRGSYQLQLVPLLTGPCEGPCRLETWIDDGPQRSLLSSVALRRVDTVVNGRRGGERVRSLLSLLTPVTIDLARFQGRRVAFSWRLVGRSSRPALLGMLRLVATAAEPPPDLLMVCSDSHRADYSVGDKGVALMPALQQLRSQATTYHQAFSPASWTLPSIASTLSGVFPRFHGCGSRLRQGDRQELADSEVPPGHFRVDFGKLSTILAASPAGLKTLPEVLRRHGYTTVLVTANGLYRLAGLAGQGNDIVVSQNVARGHLVNEMVAALLDAAQDRPLALLVHYMDVHHHIPWYLRQTAPADPARRSRPQLLASYQEAVADADTYLSELLTSWQRREGAAGSMIAFYADHGQHLLDPGRPLLDHGNSMDEVLLHVPLIVRYPTQLKHPPAEVRCPVSLIDLFPTVLEVAGIPRHDIPPMGQSLVAAARGSCQPDRLLHADFQLYGPDLSSTRQGRFKLVINHEVDSGQLVDTSLPLTTGEPGQQTSDPVREQRLRQAYDAYIRQAAAVAGSLRYEVAIDEAQAMEELRALGYVDDPAPR